MADARDLLLLAFLQQTKVRNLESRHRTPRLIGHRHRHHHEVRSRLNNVLDHFRLRLWSGGWLRSPERRGRWHVFQATLSLNGWCRQKNGQHSYQERRPQNLFNPESHVWHPSSLSHAATLLACMSFYPTAFVTA